MWLSSEQESKIFLPAVSQVQIYVKESAKSCSQSSPAQCIICTNPVFLPQCSGCRQKDFTSDVGSSGSILSFSLPPIPTFRSGKTALRERQTNSTHTAHLRHSSNFPPTDSQTDRNHPAFSFSHLSRWLRTGGSTLQPIKTNPPPPPPNTNPPQKKHGARLPSVVASHFSAGGREEGGVDMSLPRQFPWQHTGDSPARDAVALTTCSV